MMELLPFFKAQYFILVCHAFENYKTSNKRICNQFLVHQWNQYLLYNELQGEIKHSYSFFNLPRKMPVEYTLAVGFSCLSECRGKQTPLRP